MLPTNFLAGGLALPAAPPDPAELPAALAPALSLPALPPCPALSDAGCPALPAVPAAALPPTAGFALLPALGAALPALGALVVPVVGPGLLVVGEALAPARVLEEVVVLGPLAPALDASSISGSERALPHASALAINNSPAARLGSAEAWRRDGANGRKRSSSNVGGADQARGAVHFTAGSVCGARKRVM